MASGHLITHRKLTLGGDIDLDLLDDTGIELFTGFDAIHFLVVLALQFIKALFELADDLADLVADRRRVDLDPIIDICQLLQQRLGDLAVGRDDDLASLTIENVERDLLTEEDVGKSLGQLVQ